MNISHLKIRQPRRPRRWKRTAILSALFIIVLLAISLIVTPHSAPQKAEADSADAYPASCLGGWQNPANAEGAPDAGVGADAVFSDSNSAVLEDTNAELFCGSFSAESQTAAPSAVTLHFSWNVIFPGDTATSSANGTVATDTDSANWSSVLDTTSTASSSAATSTANTSTTGGAGGGGAPSVSIPAPTSTPITTPTSTPAPTPTPASASTSTPSANTAPASDTTSVSPSSSGGASSSSVTTSNSTPGATPSSDSSASSSISGATSFMSSIFKDPLTFFISRAFADSSGTSVADSSGSSNDALTTDLSGGNFMDVSYSLDGTTWVDLGDVGSSNWQDFSAAIPVTSWDQVNAIQIKLTPLLTADPPTIYLDGMWLEVDYPSPNVLEQGANAALGVLGDLGDAVTSAISDILPGDNATDTSQTADTQPSQPQPQSQPQQPQQPQQPPEPVKIIHHYSFQAEGGTPLDSKDLSWVPADDLKEYDASATASTNGVSMPTVTIVGNNSIRVAGVCSEAYYTILLFANPDDYSQNPASALFNSAEPCVGGSFSRTISDTEFPPQLPPGTYYLIVANQGTKGPWQPFPQAYPIQIGNTSS